LHPARCLHEYFRKSPLFSGIIFVSAPLLFLPEGLIHLLGLFLLLLFIFM
jgi:hypothetical protein